MSCLPLHAAVVQRVQPVVEFFLNECGMPVDICTTRWKFTALHLMTLLNPVETEMEDIHFITWLVEEKGADLTCKSASGYMASQMARDRGKVRMSNYLEAQEKRQVARKAQEKKEQEAEKKAAADAATMVRRMQEAAEAEAALLLELEAEEAAEKEAVASKKKEGVQAAVARRRRRGRDTTVAGRLR